MISNPEAPSFVFKVSKSLTPLRKLFPLLGLALLSLLFPKNGRLSRLLLQQGMLLPLSVAIPKQGLSASFLPMKLLMDGPVFPCSSSPFPERHCKKQLSQGLANLF